MTLLRILLLGLLWLVARHFFLAWRGAARGAARQGSGRTSISGPPGSAADGTRTPLTEQEISDADYEEIP